MPAEVTIPPPLRKIPPLRLPRSLIAAIQSTADSMRSPMVPRVSFAWGARELLARGCSALEAQLDSGEVPTWSVPAPPRGHRRRKGALGVEGAPAETFTLVPPLALPEPLLARLADIQRRYHALAKVKTSTATLLREGLARGYEARERERLQAAESAQRRAEILQRAGVLEAPEVITVGAHVVSPYHPSGPRDAWARVGRARPKQASANAKTPKKTSTRAVPRARSTRRKAATRRADRTEGSDDGSDAPPHVDRHEHPTSGSATPSRTLTDTDRRFLDYLIEEALRA